MSKCLIVIPDMNMGGITTACVGFCRQLISMGHQVEILIMDNNAAPATGLSPDIAIRYLKGRSKYWNLNPDRIKKERNIFCKILLLFAGALKKMTNRYELWKKIIFSPNSIMDDYDFAFAYRQSSVCYYYTLNCIRAKRKFAFVHGDIAFMQGNEKTFVPYMPFFDKVIYVSEAVKEGFINRYQELKKNGTVVLNFSHIEDIRKKASEKSDIQFNGDILNIVTVSRIEEVTKGISRVITICSKLKAQFPDLFHWYVVGDGPELENCIRQTENMGLTDCLSFIGRRSNPFPYYAGASFTVLPSKTEAYPMTVCESLILGVPVVVSRYPAAEEMICNGINGLIAEQSEEDIYEKISMLFDRKTMMQLRRNCAASRYDNKKAEEQLAALLQGA